MSRHQPSGKIGHAAIGEGESFEMGEERLFGGDENGTQPAGRREDAGAAIASATLNQRLVRFQGPHDGADTDRAGGLGQRDPAQLAAQAADESSGSQGLQHLRHVMHRDIERLGDRRRAYDLAVAIGQNDKGAHPEIGKGLFINNRIAVYFSS